jgi:integrase
VDAFFTNETAALKFANKQRKEVGHVGKEFGILGEDERSAVAFWRAFVEGSAGITPPPLIDILRDYADRWKATRTSVTVQAAFTAYEAAKTAEGLRPLSLQGINTRCGRFAKDFGTRPICTITTAEISDWLLGLAATRERGTKRTKTGSPPTIGLLAKRNYRLAISGLFTFAKSRGWTTDNPVKDAARPKPPKSRPAVLRPGEVARFFDALELHAPSLVPFWAIRFFAGVREQEALRMDWSMVNLAAKEIHLPDSVTKTGHARTIKAKPALVAFLTPHVQTDGPVAPLSSMARRYRLLKALKALQAGDAATQESAASFPVPLPANVARHSFATYHLLAFRHAGETALQLGHGGSPDMLHRHYKGVATEAQAKAFWSIRPNLAANVVTLGKRRQRTA